MFNGRLRARLWRRRMLKWRDGRKAGKSSDGGGNWRKRNKNKRDHWTCRRGAQTLKAGSRAKAHKTGFHPRAGDSSPAPWTGRVLTFWESLSSQCGWGRGSPGRYICADSKRAVTDFNVHHRRVAGSFCLLIRLEPRLLILRAGGECLFSSHHVSPALHDCAIIELNDGSLLPLNLSHSLLLNFLHQKDIGTKIIKDPFVPLPLLELGPWNLLLSYLWYTDEYTRLPDWPEQPSPYRFFTTCSTERDHFRNLAQDVCRFCIRHTGWRETWKWSFQLESDP